MCYKADDGKCAPYAIARYYSVGTTNGVCKLSVRVMQKTWAGWELCIGTLF